MGKLDIDRIVGAALAERHHVIQRRRERMRPHLTIHATAADPAAVPVTLTDYLERDVGTNSCAALQRTPPLVVRAPASIPRLLTPSPMELAPATIITEPLRLGPRHKSGAALITDPGFERIATTCSTPKLR